jgi:hypothetical protein
MHAQLSWSGPASTMTVRRCGAAEHKDFDAMTTTDAQVSPQRTPTPRPARRLVTDFLFGLFLFNLAACALMPRSIDAYAATLPGSPHAATSEQAHGFVTTGFVASNSTVANAGATSPQHFASLLAGGHDRAGRPLPGPIGLIVLSLVFATLTALNLQLIRHLREAYVAPSRKRRAR